MSSSFPLKCPFQNVSNVGLFPQQSKQRFFLFSEPTFFIAKCCNTWPQHNNKVYFNRADCLMCFSVLHYPILLILSGAVFFVFFEGDVLVARLDMYSQENGLTGCIILWWCEHTLTVCLSRLSMAMTGQNSCSSMSNHTKERVTMAKVTLENFYSNLIAQHEEREMR